MKSRWKLGGTVLAAAFAAACAVVPVAGPGAPMPGPGAPMPGPSVPMPGPSVPAISGSVDFGRRTVQASTEDIAVAATVSLIETSGNRTIATTLTDDNGDFLLGNFSASFAPGTATYYLEAVKRLSSNAAGANAARVRTVVQFQAGGWVSITNASPGPITLNRSATALSVIASLRRADTPAVDSASLIGVLQVGVADSSADPPTPDTLTTAGTNVSNVEFHRIFGFVDATLKANQDPLATVSYTGTNKTYALAPSVSTSVLPTVSNYSPTAAGVGATIVILGDRFGTSPEANTVDFGTVRATVQTASQTELRVLVPAGAPSGPITVTTALGSGAGPTFTVIPDLGGDLKP